MIRVVLNATATELAAIGGDFSFYWDLLQLSDRTVSYELVPDSSVRRASWMLRRLATRACYSGQPAGLRRLLSCSARTVRVPSRTLPLNRVDAVLSHLWFPSLARNADVPVIWSSQGISPPEYYQRIDGSRWSIQDVHHLHRVLGARSDRLLIWTRTCARNVVEAYPELQDRIRVVHPAVFVEGLADVKKPSMHDGKLRLHFIGRDAELKGPPRGSICLPRSSGTEDPREAGGRIEAGASLEAELHNEPHVILYPLLPRTQLQRLMAEADILVNPSKADTYAMVAVEAMAQGCAVIVSDLEPLPEVVPDGQAGLVARRGDAGSVTSKLLELADDEPFLRRLQRGAREVYARRNHPEVAGAKFRHVLEEAIHG